MYTLKIRLNPIRYDKLFEKWFDKGYTLKKATVKWFNNQERKRRNSEEYKYLASKTKELEELKNSLKETKDKEKKQQLKAEIKDLSDFLKESWTDLNNVYNLNNSKYAGYKKLGQATYLYELYAKELLVNSSIFEAIANSLKEAYLKRKKQSSSDNYLNAGRYVDFTTLLFRKMENRVTDKGVFFTKLDKKTNKKVKFLIPFDFRQQDEERLTYALEFHKLAQFMLKRERDKRGRWAYYVLLVFDGMPYGVDHYEKGTGIVTVSVDIDRLAIKAENESSGQTIYYDISNDHGYSKILSDLDRQIEWKRRINNPDNYEDNGVIKEGARKWVRTKSYDKLLAKKRSIWYKIGETRKQRFNKIAKEIVTLGDEIVVIKEDFKSLQKHKDYNPEQMDWYSKRKQKGAEIMFNAPYQFIMSLKERADYKNIDVIELVKK